MGPIGWPETVFIFFLALLLFGPKKLPELARTIGKGIGDFQRLKGEWKAALDGEAKQLSEGTESLASMVDHYRSEIAAIDLSVHESSERGLYESGPYVPFPASAPASLEAHLAPALLEGAPAGLTGHGTETKGQLS